jgi:hypothetical protein
LGTGCTTPSTEDPESPTDTQAFAFLKFNIITARDKTIITLHGIMTSRKRPFFSCSCGDSRDGDWPKYDTLAIEGWALF